MDRIKELEQFIADASDEIRDLQDADKREAALQCVGKFYKYRNSYSSCPESDDDRWWVYRAALAAQEWTVDFLDFQIDKYGKHEIERGLHSPILSGWTEIHPDEYKLALTKFRESALRLLSETSQDAEK